MRKTLFALLSVFVALTTNAQEFEKYFADNTLRVDYIFAGNRHSQSIYIDELSELPSWAGRRERLSELPLTGNGQIIMSDMETGKVIYKTSFSSLFQEWLTVDESDEICKSFENTFLLPYPLNKVYIEVSLLNEKHEVRASMTHIVDPKDILIHTKGLSNITPHKYLLKNGSGKDCIDVAILAEGYTVAEMNEFYKDAETACESLFSHEPFKSYKSKFNIVAVASPSNDSGVSVPRLNQWRSTAFSSSFSTFYSDRYLTTARVKSVHDALAGIPYEHIIILANEAEYGGGGIYNSYTLTTTKHPMFSPVVVHEFGHSFGGLADEYFYENDTFSDTYPFDVEPWEQNITTMIDFDAKWKDILKTGTPVPTPAEMKAEYPVGVYEGAGYSSKGIYRPAHNCRMRTNDYTVFCPVCQRALTRMIKFYTE